jgi:hypothetical protein
MSMNYQQLCNVVQEEYAQLHPHLYELHDQHLAPSLVQAIRAGTSEALARIYRQVHPGVFVFDMLQPDFCKELLEEVACFENWCRYQKLPLLRPNTMNRYGTILDTLGFGSFLHQLMSEYVTPFASREYADIGGDALDGHHGFIVEYQVGKDVKLDFHVDASEVTLNVCLGKAFTGGELYFRGVRCELHQETPWRPDEDFAIRQVPGRAILHRGRHRHGAHPVTSGERYNLILWCSSSCFARHAEGQSCPAWCGYQGQS